MTRQTRCLPLQPNMKLQPVGLQARHPLETNTIPTSRGAKFWGIPWQLDRIPSNCPISDGGDPLYWGDSIKLMRQIAYLAHANRGTKETVYSLYTRLHTWHMLTGALKRQYTAYTPDCILM
ncbi:hypothetical protein GBAR_LOCUS10682 [Geodia barretti]|uniref:Uncharacterized protein n=1 Tax=Geodia barretti TaxID=519541 RepID=A0AA35RTW2_GEOBA|nr:hypothetical protein GBAR_LOCUS10682 [Geodia barretti]